MKCVVLLQHLIGQIFRVHVRAGLGSIDRATGLTSEQVALLYADDRFAIEKEMTR